MTQDTNNQEWWEEEWRDQFAESGIDYGEDADELAEEWNQKQIAFIRKVSQQSREDALKEYGESSLEKTLKLLYDSEINVCIQSFWDAGWMPMLGDSRNGYQRPDWDSCEVDELNGSLIELAIEHYPRSKFVSDLSKSKLPPKQ